MCSDTRASRLHLLVPINQIQQREKINPHNIDEVPVETDVFDRRVLLRRETALERFLDQPNEQARANDHVHGVEAGHREIERKEELRVGVGGHVRAWFEIKTRAGNVVLFILGVIFDGLDAEKNGAKKQSQDKKECDELLFSDLGGPDRHGHGQAAGDEDDGVETAKFQVEALATFREDSGIGMTVDGIGQEHAAEKEDFGSQENPHAEGSRFFLLLHRLKMPVKFAGAMHAVLLFFY